MDQRRHVIVGIGGPVGNALAHRLHGAGAEVVGICRSGRADVPEPVVVEAADARDVDAMERLAAGAAVIYCCVGMPYTYWREHFPPVIQAMIRAAEASGARLVFADNLYCYGPVDQTLTEQLPGTDFGSKPALRAQLSREIFDAHEQGRIRATIGRAADFYGPGVTNSMLGERVFPALLAGKKVQLVGNPDLPHTYTYVPDFARALVTLGHGQEALGRAWHVPNAPTRTTREVIEQAAGMAGTEPRVSTMPGWMLAAVALVSSPMRELREMDYQWTRPLVVDDTAFSRSFWGDATPWEQGLRTTLDWYRTHGRNDRTDESVLCGGQ